MGSQKNYDCEKVQSAYRNPDATGDILDEETIRQASLIYNRLGLGVDVQHTLQPVKEF